MKIFEAYGKHLMCWWIFNMVRILRERNARLSSAMRHFKEIMQELNFHNIPLMEVLSHGKGLRNLSLLRLDRIP